MEQGQHTDDNQDETMMSEAEQRNLGQGEETETPISTDAKDEVEIVSDKKEAQTPNADEPEESSPIEETPEMKVIRDKLAEIRGPLLKLKWDAEHDQLNPGKKPYYDKLKKDFEELESALKKEIEKQKSK